MEEQTKNGSSLRTLPSPDPDPWKHRTQNMKCDTCLWYLAKSNGIGRCRRHAPTMSGYPVVFGAKDWCGDHKLTEVPRSGSVRPSDPEFK